MNKCEVLRYLPILTRVPSIINVPFAEHTFSSGGDYLAEEAVTEAVTREHRELIVIVGQQVIDGDGRRLVRYDM